MFEECFEKMPTADPDGDFARVLTAINEGTGLQVPVDQLTLELALTAN